MARSQATVEAELYDLAASWFRNPIGIALLSGLARVLVFIEIAADVWQKELYRQTASGGFLDSHGTDGGITRDYWEDDATFRPRAVSESRGPTIAFLQSEMDRVAFPYANGHRVSIHEPKINSSDVDTFADLTVVYGIDPDLEESKFVVAVEVPVGEVPATVGFFADYDHADFEFAHPLPWNLLRNQFLRPIAVFVKDRPIGVGLRAEIRDTLQTAHASALGHFDTAFYV